MIGHALLAEAAARGHHGIPVQRPAQNPRMQPARAGAILWDPEAVHPFADLEMLEGMDAVVHLAGANIAAQRWTPAYKRQICESRTQPTSALALVLARLQRPPKVLVSASATGFYGSRGEELLTEETPGGEGFLCRVCDAWERATAPAEAAGIRVVHARFGVVLSPFGGALKQMLPLFRMGLGGRLGNGQEWMSWIALEDLLNALFWAMEHEGLQGPVNMSSPQPVRNTEFTKALAAAVHRPAVLPAPAFALRTAFGEMANEMLLTSCRVVPAKLQESGFVFGQPEIGAALAGMLRYARA